MGNHLCPVHKSNPTPQVIALRSTNRSQPLFLLRFTLTFCTFKPQQTYKENVRRLYFYNKLNWFRPGYCSKMLGLSHLRIFYPSPLPPSNSVRNSNTILLLVQINIVTSLKRLGFSHYRIFGPPAPHSPPPFKMEQNSNMNCRIFLLWNINMYTSL